MKPLIFLKIIFHILFIFGVCSVSAQNDSSQHINSITTSFKESNFGDKNTYTLISSELTDTYNYLPNNTIGNIGMPVNSLSYMNSFGLIGFNYARNTYSNYFFNHHTLNFYSTRSPYTDLLYVMGSKKEQVFKGVFSYNIKPNWNISVYFNRLRAEGFYLRQNVNSTHIALSSNYESLTKRYACLLSAVYNDSRNFENGGIKFDTAFTQGGLIDKKILQINLQQAKRNMLNRAVVFKQFLNIGEKENDSTQTIIPAYRFSLESSYEDNDWRYYDENPLSGFYSNITQDSLITNDKIYNSKIQNTLAWERLDNKKQRGLIDWFGFSLGATHQFVTIKQSGFDTLFNNIIAGVNFYNTYSKKDFFYRIKYDYVAFGYNKNDYSGMISLSKNVFSFFKASIFAGKDIRTPDFIYLYYQSNHFNWSNTMNKTEKSYAGLSVVSSKHKMDVSIIYSKYTSVPYFDNYAIARQYDGKVGVFTINAAKNFKLKNWHLDNLLTYNSLPDSVVIRLPQFVLRNSLYYENNVFKNAMRLRIGVSLFYTSAYYANAYMPATAMFYIQDAKKYGDYPFLDFFICAKIKTVNAFLKIEHLNSGLMGNRYVQTPNYPTNDRAFKVGISWKFFD